MSRDMKKKHEQALIDQRVLADLHAAALETRDDTKQSSLFSVLRIPVLCDSAELKNKIEDFQLLYKASPALLTQQDEEGNTVFHSMACLDALQPLLSECLKEKAEGALIANHQGEYPIHTAILQRQEAIITHLLTHPGVCMQRDKSGKTILHYAAQYGSKEVLERCLEAGSELINSRDSNGQTPLMIAVAAARQDLLNILIAQGADASLHDHEGASILHLAMDTENPHMIKWALENDIADINYADGDKSVPLDYLRQEYHHKSYFSEIEHLLLEAGARSGMQVGF